MKKLLLIFVAVALLAGLLAWGMLNNSGYLLIAVGDYSIEMSLWTGMLILLFSYLLVRLFAKLWHLIFSAGRAGKNATRAGWFYRERRDRNRTLNGLSHFLQGQWRLAQRELVKGAKFSQTPLLNYLGAARAAHHLGDKPRAGEYLKRAEALDGMAAAAVKADLYLRDGDYQRALAILQQLQKKGVSDLLPLMVSAREGLGDWDGIRQMLPELKRHKALSEEHYQQLQRRAYQALLVADSREQTWREIPASLRRDPELIAAYVRSLQSITNPAEGSHKAEKILHKALRQNWDKQLVSLYGIVEGEDVSKQLHTAESWLKEHQDDPTLLVTLARLSAKNQLWGKARDYFKRSLELEPRREIYAELGRLLERLGDNRHSTDCFRHGLELAINEQR